MHCLYLVRHARPAVVPSQHQSTWELDPAGAEELAALAALPFWQGVSRVYCSTERKAIQTAEAITSRNGLPEPTQVAGLRELEKGGWVGGSHAEVMAEVFRHPDRPVAPGWECASAALDRFRTCSRELLDASGSADVAFVSHGTVLSLYLAELAGRSHVDPAAWASIAMPDLAVVETRTMKLTRPFGAWRGA